MKKLSSLILLLVVCAQIANAGQIYGNVKEGNRSVGEGIEVSINCAGKPIAARTDSYGSYKIGEGATGSAGGPCYSERI